MNEFGKRGEVLDWDLRRITGASTLDSYPLPRFDRDPERDKMSWKISITEEGDRQFRALPARARGILEAAIGSRLQHQPTTPTKAIKRLRPNPLAEFELRAGDLRALYNVERDEVIVLIVGRKVGNKLIVEGEEFHGHQVHPVEPPGSGPKEDAE